MLEKYIVAGAAGFTGAVLIEELRKRDDEVFAIVRPESAHNLRLDQNDDKIHIIELQGKDYSLLKDRICDKCDCFIHLLSAGENNVESQKRNTNYALLAAQAAAECGCNRIVLTGSQAEYGIVPSDEMAYEERTVKPITAYGAAKVATCELTRIRAKELGIEWIWGRIFSLIGKYEPRGRMLPDLYSTLKAGKSMNLSSCRQNWDYLDVYDAADALIALAEKGHSGEIYNIAHGAYRPLREYTEAMKDIIGGKGEIHYGDDPDPFISLQPSVEKIRRDTGWRPKRSFEESIRDY